MKKIKSLYIPQLIFIFMMPVLAWASDISYSLVGIQGYDPVSYFQQGSLYVVAETTRDIMKV